MQNFDQQVYAPLNPRELERLQIIFETARYSACMSRYDPAAESLAALTIRLYQSGLRDDETLLRTLVQAGKTLRQAQPEPNAEPAHLSVTSLSAHL